MRPFLSILPLILLLFAIDGIPAFGQLRPGQLLPPPPSGVIPAKSAVPELDLPMFLMPQFVKGNTYRFTTETDIQMDIPGQGLRTIRIEQQARFDSSPREKNKKGITLKGLTEHLIVKIQSNELSMNYDSLDAKTRNTPIGKQMHSGMIRRVEMDLNKSLRTVSFKEVGRIGLPGPLKGMPTFGPDELKHLIESIAQGYPDFEVKPGDEWPLTGTHSVAQSGEVEFEMVYRHAGQVLQDRTSCIVIEFSGHVVGDLPPTTEGESKFQGNRIEGKMIYDPKQKMVRVIEQSISMAIALPTIDPEVEPVLIPIEQKVIMKLLHVVPIQ